MAVLVKIANRGASLAMYDQLSSRLLPEAKRQAGFHIHICYPVDDGFAVNEVWDTAEQHRAWYEGNIRPNLPPDAHPQIEVVELHNVATK